MTIEKHFEVENQRFELGFIEPNDIDDLIQTARQWVRNRFTKEVEEKELFEIRERMLSSLESSEYKYLVVRNQNHKAIGCCAIREPEERMQQYKSTLNKSTELVNVFLDNTYRGKGVGYKFNESYVCRGSGIRI